MPSVLTANKYPIDTLTFGKHKPNANSGYNIEISLGDTTNEVLLQTPKMRCPFGVSTDKTNPFKRTLDLSFQGLESNPSMKSFRDLVEKVDAMTIDYALANSKTFFKKELSREVLKENYYSGIKQSKKEQYSDTFKCKVLFKKPDVEKGIPDGKYITSFWNTKGDEQPATHLDKGDYATCLIKPQMLWVANRSFGISWVCTQVRVHKQQKTTGCSFVKTEDDVESESDEELVEVEESEEEVEVEVD